MDKIIQKYCKTIKKMETNTDPFGGKHVFVHDGENMWEFYAPAEIFHEGLNVKIGDVLIIKNGTKTNIEREEACN